MDLIDRKLELRMEYTKGHANKLIMHQARLNYEADHYASSGSCQLTAAKLFITPQTTFCMDEYTFHTDRLGWLEINIKPLITSLIDQLIANKIGTGHSLRMARWLYNDIPPSEYPYKKAALAFSAMVQLYLRSGQLPTADNMFRKHLKASNLC